MCDLSTEITWCFLVNCICDLICLGLISSTIRSIMYVGFLFDEFPLAEYIFFNIALENDCRAQCLFISKG